MGPIQAHLVEARSKCRPLSGGERRIKCLERGRESRAYDASQAPGAAPHARGASNGRCLETELLPAALAQRTLPFGRLPKEDSVCSAILCIPESLGSSSPC